MRGSFRGDRPLSVTNALRAFVPPPTRGEGKRSYRLAHTIHATSDAASVRSACAGLSDCCSTAFAVPCLDQTWSGVSILGVLGCFANLRGVRASRNYFPIRPSFANQRKAPTRPLSWADAADTV